MMSDNENEKRETVADIVAMVRRAAQYYDGEAEKSEGLLRETFKLSAANYRAIADLVEAAWKREKAEAGANALAVGNSAAMREALVVVRKDLWEMMGSSSDSFRERKACDMARRIRAALSAPPRNCDMYDNWYDAHQAWERLPKDELGYFVAANGVHECEQAWLFAPAEERKGEGDGK